MIELARCQTAGPRLYFDKYFSLDAAKISPGEYFSTPHDMVLVTVLGSCVAACIHDKVNRIGGINHFMLPDDNDNHHNPLGAPARYGGYAMEILINDLLKLGARRENLEAKVFGGGRVLSGFTTETVGERNAAFVLDYLCTEKIYVAAQDLLDIYPRKVYYFPHTGKVLVKKLLALHNDTIFKREKAYKVTIKSQKISGDVELFT